MLKIPEINKKNFAKVLRELDLSLFPSLLNEEYLMTLKRKLEKKITLSLSEQLIGFARFKGYLNDSRVSLNNYFVSNIDFTPFANRPPRPFQEEGAKWLLQRDRCILADDQGLGKAAPLDSRILTPCGWVLMKDIKVNDDIIGKDGNFIKVTGVFPQGVKDVYKIHFNDKTWVETCKEHLWSVTTVRNRNFKTLSLEQIKMSLKEDSYDLKRVFIPLVDPINFNAQPTNINPYLLGLLLGDGCIKFQRASLSTNDKEIIDLLPSLLPSGISCRKSGKFNYSLVSESRGKKNPLIRFLKAYNLGNCGSSEKFIPNEYKYNTIQTRVEVLQGLMDTDGYIAKDGTLVYYTTSTQLKNDVRELVLSLGGTTKESWKQGRYKSPKTNLYVNCKQSCALVINLPLSIIPFKLTRKKIRLKKVKKYLPRRKIIKIEYSRSTETQCISVSADNHLYVMDNYTVTHNTMQIIIAALNLQEDYKILIVTTKTLKYNFEKELSHYSDSYKVIEKKWETGYKFTIVHYEGLKKFKKEIKEEAYQVIVADECHCLINPKSAKSKAFKEVLTERNNDLRKLWLLTGTPVTNRPSDLYSLLHLIKHPVAKNWVKYVEEFCNGYIDFYGRWKVNGSSNLKKLHDLVKDSILRRLKKDHLEELPSKDRQTIFLKLENRKGYDGVVKAYQDKKFLELEGLEDLMLDAEDINVNELTKLALQRQFCAMEKIKDGSLFSIIQDELDLGNKVIVFTNYTKIIDEVYNHFTDGMCRFIDGRITNPKKRLEIAEEFNNSTELRVIALNIKVGGTGLNIQSANSVIVNDMDWVPGNMAQAEDRAWRFGQLREVTAKYLIYMDTIDEDLLFNLINEKTKSISQIMEGKVEKYFEDGKEDDSEKLDKAEQKRLILKQILSKL